MGGIPGLANFKGKVMHSAQWDHDYDLRGKKVAIWPGSTQEVFILERLRLEGMSVKDIQATRVPFGEMHAMLSRGDIDGGFGASFLGAGNFGTTKKPGLSGSSDTR